MANSNDKEVEIKLPLNKAKFDSLKKEISKKAKLIGTSTETDTYFNHPNKDFLKPKYPFEWLRIRKKDGRSILNYKHFHPENVETTLYCDELETVVDSSKSMEKILLALGYKTIIKVVKERTSYLLDSKYEFSFDKVSNLGYFVEIEFKSKSTNIQSTHNNLIDLAQRFDIDTSKAEKRGYPYLLMSKLGLIKLHN